MATGGVSYDALPSGMALGRSRTAAASALTRAQIFAEVLTAGPLSRKDLADRMRLSQSTVTIAVNPLVEAGYLIEGGEKSSGIGRPQRLLRVARNQHMAIGLKVAPRRVAGVLTDLQAGVLARSSRPLRGGPPVRALARTAEVVSDLLRSMDQARERLLGVGVGVGGHVDARTGRCVHSGVLGWDDVDVAGELTRLTGLPVLVNNDVNALVVAEQWFGAGRGVDSFAVVTVGPGVGCGLLLHGELITGVSGSAGELGHIPLAVDGADGPLCTCGNRGCLEALASDGAVLDAIEAAGRPRPTRIDEAVRMARRGDGAAVVAFARRGEALGRGLATICNLLNVGKIVLTGEGVHAYDLFGEACERSLRAHAFSTAAESCELVVDPADDNMWARGAACPVIREAVGALLA